MTKFTQLFRKLNDKTKDLLTYLLFGAVILILTLAITASVRFLILSLMRPDQTQAPQSYAMYVVKEQDGKIQVFDQQNQVVIQTDILADTLPTLDRAMLQSGIEVSDQAALQQLLEDFE